VHAKVGVAHRNLTEGDLGDTAARARTGRLPHASTDRNDVPEHHRFRSQIHRTEHRDDLLGDFPVHFDRSEYRHHLAVNPFLRCDDDIAEDSDPIARPMATLNVVL
jgi:hypothetical protein